MPTTRSTSFPGLLALAMALAALALLPAVSRAQAIDPQPNGPFTVTEIEQAKLGTVQLQEPAANGNAPGSPGGTAAATVQLRGQMFYPADRASGSPVIVLVHGNHAACQTGSSPNCTIFKHNDRGYAYLGANLASHGYTVFSLDQDQLIFYQDGTARGMHQRRLAIAATLDALFKLNAEAVPVDADNNVGAALVGKLDMSRIGLMGHSRGGDAVTSFIDFNRKRPAPGRRYTGLRGVISLASTDYERMAPYGNAFLSILPACDGDVSNLQAARHFERSQYTVPGDPYPKMQLNVHGTNHNWFNSVWFVDGDDSTTSDPACSTNSVTNPNNIRLSGGTYTRTGDTGTFGSSDPALMGDQEKVGLATMGSFFRRYVGSELGFDSYFTGERQEDGVTPVIATSLCPSLTPAGTRISCFDRIQSNYFAPPAERRDVIGPDPDNPLTVTALGTALTGSGFSNPFVNPGGVNPIPATTAGGYDWCNPDPNHFTPTAVGETGNPTAFKACPLPTAAGLGGQNGARENAPVNRSYGLQLALAWNDPVAATGSPAKLTTRIPADSGNVSGLKALTLAAAVNYFDPRNPARTGDALWNPGATTQDFTIAVTDAAGVEGTVSAASPRYGTALHQTVGNVTARVHVTLNEIRVPVSDFAAQGVDITKLRKLEFRFGEAGKPLSGSIQVADVKFQESVTGPTALRDAQAAKGLAELVEQTPREVASAAIPDVVPINGTTLVTSLTKCLDVTAPVSSITSKVLRGGRLTLKGKASDRGCAAVPGRSAVAGKVKLVNVTLSKALGKGRCRFVRASGALTAPLACDSGYTLVAKGTTAWSVSLKKRLAKGRYRLTVRAVDAAGRQSKLGKRTTITIA